MSGADGAALRLGVICGMRSEADTLGALVEDPRIGVRVSGGRPDMAAQAAQALLEQGARGLVSYGIAGALSPHANAGDWIVADAVEAAADGARWALNPAPLATGDDAEDAPLVRGDLLGAERIIARRPEKAALYARSAAVAVDMESHCAAEAAALRGVACFALRTVADTASREIPDEALDGLDAEGRPRPFAVAAKLARRPWRLPRLLAVKRDVDVALAALAARGPETLRRILATEVDWRPSEALPPAEPAL